MPAPHPVPGASRRPAVGGGVWLLLFLVQFNNKIGAEGATALAKAMAAGQLTCLQDLNLVQSLVPTCDVCGWWGGVWERNMRSGCMKLRLCREDSCSRTDRESLAKPCAPHAASSFRAMGPSKHSPCLTPASALYPCLCFPTSLQPSTPALAATRFRHSPYLPPTLYRERAGGRRLVTVSPQKVQGTLRWGVHSTAWHRISRSFSRSSIRIGSLGRGILRTLRIHEVYTPTSERKQLRYVTSIQRV
eukprot:2116032-Rhodomonas_salina.2